jgi:Ala-tRNA(Pro) deacylase
MSCIDRLAAYLREHHAPFSIQYHPPAFTAQEVAAAEHLPAIMMAKVVVVDADGALVMLVLPASFRVDMTLVAEALGASEVHLADERTLADAFPDCALGAMPPFGNMYGIPVVVAEQLAAQERIVFQAGSHIETMQLAYADFARLAQPAVADFARHMRELAAPAW